MSEIDRKIIRPVIRQFAQMGALASLAMLCACQPETATPGPDSGDTGFKLTAHRQSGALPADSAIAFTNRLGDIRVRNQPGSEYLITAQIQKLNGESRDIEFSEKVSDGTLIVEVIAPDGFDGRVDAALLVPDTHPVKLITDSGLIQARVNKNPIEAKSVTGKVAVRSLATLALETTEGPVEVTVHRHGIGDTQIKTVSGNVQIEMPPESNLALNAKTGGKFTTALAPGVKHATKQASGKLELKLGAGEADVQIESESGDILLRSYGYEAGQP